MVESVGSPYDPYMPRKGRALELLIARLEAATSSGEAEVRSPDYFADTISGTTREVDVTVRSKVGSANVLVMFECRDRAGKQDVRWIEEIHGKRQVIRPNVAVAVTSGQGFSTGAQNTARHLGIEVRTVEQITVEDVVGWCRLQHLTVNLQHVRKHGFNIQYFEDTPPMAEAVRTNGDGSIDLPLDAPILTLWDANYRPPPDAPEWMTGKELHRLGMDMMFHRARGLDFSDWQSVSVTMSDLDRPLVAVRTSEGPYPLAGVKVTAEVRVEESQVPVTIHAVTSHEGEQTQVVEAVVTHEGEEHTVSFIHADEGTSVLMESRQHKEP